ncbi:hypothetical protein [Deinococcus sp. Leaf326]|uniref:hypothetical protein n=1 Tax=Deinococcus sp. Leaf326 TaxID=1736338 RepID=UPI0006FF8FA0|nr:hypothetical protein [Deinococcus sp. Leaf326]KQR40739.1 hypothetical protein ASF71_00800 [Deinococcus sp. Leaf326]
MIGEGCGERYSVITEDGYGYQLPGTLEPSHWLGALHPAVHGFPLSDVQVRTDDYKRDAVPLSLAGDIHLGTETTMHDLAAEIQYWVQLARWLQRADRAVTRLLEGNDIELGPSGKKSKNATLRVVVVQQDRRWFGPDGREVTG